MAKAVGIDLGTTNSVVAAVMEGGQAEVIPNAEGGRDDAVGGGVHRGRPAAGRPGRQAPGDPQPGGDDLLGQALHRPQVGRGRRGGEDRLLQGRQGPERRGALRGPRQAVRAGGDLRAGPAQAGRRRRASSSASASPRRSSPCPRTSTTRSARRPRTPGKIAGLEVLRIINEPTAAALAYGLDKKGSGDRAGLRPRRRHVRRLDPRRRRRRGRGALDQRRRPPRRRRLRQADRRLAGRRVQARPGHRPAPATRRRCSASTRRPSARRSSCRRPRTTQINLPFITADASGPEAPEHDAHAREVRAAHRAT